MCLLDSIIDYSNEHLTASLAITTQSPFFANGSVPGYVGIEYMAQAVAAFAGVCSRLQGQPVRIGFLVSARKLQSSCSNFPLGSEMQVRAERIAHDVDGLSVFACRITGQLPNGENIQVSANLNVFVPSDVEQYFEQIA